MTSNLTNPIVQTEIKFFFVENDVEDEHDQKDRVIAEDNQD